MSSDRNIGEQLTLAVLISFVILLVTWLTGCARPPFPFETPAPTSAEMAALMAHAGAPVAQGKPADVTLIVYPRVVLWGSGVRLRCLVADAPQVLGAVRLAIEGTRVTMVELPNAIEQVIVIERLPCGTSAATCTVVRRGRPTILRRDTVTVTGGMCDDGVN